MVRSALVISDIHLGASSSLLTAIDYDPETHETFDRPLAKAVLDRLIADVKTMTCGEKIQQCILLGDIFDFSFAPYGLAMKNGRWFFETLVAANLFEEFVYVPGNHDHHLWQQITEHYYLIDELDNPPLTYPKTLPGNFTLNNTFLDRLLPDGHDIQVTYPNYQFSIHGRPYFLHHGHYLQKLYIAASNLLAETIQTNDIEDLETLNAPFLEFGWYNIGQAYNIGKQKLIDKLYFLYKNHNTQQLDRLFHMVLGKIDQWQAPHRTRQINPIGMLTDSIVKWLGPFMLKRLFFKHSRFYGKGHHASSSRHKRLSDASSIPVIEYIQKFMLDEETQGCTSCTFIFGHTHEPEDVVITDKNTQRRYHILNTGGWVVDQVNEDGQLQVPHMAPIFIGEDGVATPIPFTQSHRDFLQEQIDTDPVFQQVYQDIESV